MRLEAFQEEGELMFVPSGWYHEAGPGLSRQTLCVQPAQVLEVKCFNVVHKRHVHVCLVSLAAIA